MRLSGKAGNGSERVEPYRVLVAHLHKVFGSRLKTAVLFGSRAREEGRPESDHDVLLVIDGLPRDVLARHRTIRQAVMPVLTSIPQGIKFVAMTPSEWDANLTPLLLDVCVDGICLLGSGFFEPYRTRALAALETSGLQRKKTSRGAYWIFPDGSPRDWELDWDGFRERS